MEHRYLKKIITFTYDKPGNVANLSRIDPSLLGVKDADGYTKNALYLHGLSSAPLLCISLVVVTRDNHKYGRTFGSESKEYFIKDISGVLLAMELERFIAVLGLAYELPYVPNDNTRKESDLLYFSMADNAFNFTSRMISKAGECLDDLYSRLLKIGNRIRQIHQEYFIKVYIYTKAKEGRQYFCICKSQQIRQTFHQCWWAKTIFSGI